MFRTHFTLMAERNCEWLTEIGLENKAKMQNAWQSGVHAAYSDTFRLGAEMNSSRIGVIGGRYLLTQSPC